MSSPLASDADEPFWLGPVTPEEVANALEFFAWNREQQAEYDATHPDDAGAGGWFDGDAEAVWQERPDSVVAEAMLSHPAQLADAFTIDTLDLSALESPLLALKVAKRIDEVTAMLAARRAAVLVEVAEPTASARYLDEVHVETEVVLALGVSPASAGWDITIARALATEFRGFGAALGAGEVSLAHCRKLVDLTASVPDRTVAMKIGELALAKAKGRTVAQFADSLRRLVARYDRDAVVRRAEAVRTQRDVSVQRMDDGLGRLVYVDEWTKVNAVGNWIRNAGRATQLHRKREAAAEKARAAGVEHPSQGGERSKVKQGRKMVVAEHADAMRGLEDGVLTAAGCRADAILAIVLGREHDDGTVVLDTDPVVVNVEVVMDLETLRGEADHIALLDGTPVPAEVGRQWARHARTYRRMVTDPVTGHLLDRGKTYMADDVRDFVIARDGGCRVPVCGIQHPSRLQADHAQPAPEGDTSSANLGALSTTHHQLKTDGYLHIEDSKADGSATLTTLWGQRIVIPPRAYLDDPQPRAWDRNAKPWDWDAPPPF